MQHIWYICIYRENKFIKMRISQLYLVIVLGTAALTSCKKEPVPEPTPQAGCPSCTCNEFDYSGINESFTSATYGSVFYYQAYTEMTGRYVDYSMNMYGSGSVDVIPLDAIWQAECSNYTGEILRFADAAVKFDYSNYANVSKTVSFDANLDLGDYTFLIDGLSYAAPPAGVSVNVTNLTNGKHIAVSGNFTAIELGGWELAIDNMCIEDYVPAPSNPFCEEYEDTTFNTVCPSSQTSYGAPFYSSNGVSFRCKHVDYEGVSFLDGSVYLGAPNSYGADQNVNFSGQLLQVNNVDLELDFSGLSYTNKSVSFDISNVWDINDPNEFMVNGVALSTIPAGITYNVTSLGSATNGDPCYHVTIEGPINTIVLVGWEITYDNLCVDEL